MSETEKTKFSFETELKRGDLLDLAKFNSDVYKQCFWIPNMAFSNGVTFEADEAYEGEKYGEPYPFPTFMDFLEWSGIWEQLETVVGYSCLFGVAIAVCLNDDPPSSLKGKPYYGPVKGEEIEPAYEVKAFYPHTDVSGYWIEQYDEKGNPEIYKIEITNKSWEMEPAKNTKNPKTVYYVHADRVVRFPALQLDLSLPGTPKTYLTAHMAKAKQILIESVVNAAKNMSAGTVVRRVANEEEMDALEAANTTPSYENRIYIIGGIGNLNEKVQVYVPDLKSTQFVDFTRTINKYLASASNLSLRNYGEEDLPGGLGDGSAQFSISLIQSEIKDIQSHYYRPIEHVFHLLGKEVVEFEWNLPEQLMELTENDGTEPGDNSDTSSSDSGEETAESGTSGRE